MSADADLPAQLAAVGAFLGQASLGKTVADLEIALADCDRNGVAAVAAEYGVTVALLRAAIVSREALGKISDLTHAAAITLSLEHILESGEKLVRPSLAAGNTKARLSDVETDRRVAEFKLARWTGADGARQKSAVKDLARLAVESSPRVAELCLRGPRPIAWLRRTKSSVRQQLKGFPAQLAAFEKSFDDPSVAVSTFVANAAAHVTLIDVEDRLPELFAPGAM